MFGVLWGVLLVAVVMGLEPVARGTGSARLELLLAGLPALAGIGAVLYQWSRHPHGIKDWVQGGVVDVGQADAERVTWTDWAIMITRRGVVDRRSGFVRLERALLCGLIPIGTILRPLGEFYRVEVKVEERTSRRRHRRFEPFGDGYGYEERVVGYTYSLYLVDRRGDRLCVLDLGTGLGGFGEGFVGELRQRLEAVVGRPGEAPAPPPGAERGAPPPDDFEAWRAKRKGPPAGA